MMEKNNVSMYIACKCPADPPPHALNYLDPPVNVLKLSVFVSMLLKLFTYLYNSICLINDLLIISYCKLKTTPF